MQACIPCHLKKTRCLGELPSCLNCVRRGRECSYPTARKQVSATPVSTPDSGQMLPTQEQEVSAPQKTPAPVTGHKSPSSPGPGTNTEDEKVLESSLPDDETMTKFLEDYFEYLYPLPFFAFLHKPTVIRRCRDGTVNEPLKFASK